MNMRPGRPMPMGTALAGAVTAPPSRSSLPETMDLSDEALQRPSPDEHQYRMALLRLARAVSDHIDTCGVIDELAYVYDSLTESGLLVEPEDPAL